MTDNLRDIVGRLYIRSTPVMRVLKRTPASRAARKETIQSEDDEIVESFFIMD